MDHTATKPGDKIAYRLTFDFHRDSPDQLGLCVAFMTQVVMDGSNLSDYVPLIAGKWPFLVFFREGDGTVGVVLSHWVEEEATDG